MTDDMQINDNGGLPQAGRIIERFGGIRPMAGKMSVPVTTVQGWKKRDLIPDNRRGDVERAAVAHGIDLSDLLPAAANSNFADSLAQVSKTSPNQPIPAIYEKALSARLNQVGQQSELRAVRKSTAITLLIVLLVGGAAGLLLVPSQQREAMDHQEIAELQQHANAGPQVGQLQQKVQALEAEFSSLKSQASNAVAGVTGGGTDPVLVNRVSTLELQMRPLISAAHLQSLFGRLLALQDNSAGENTLLSAIGSLNGLLGNAQTPAQVDTTLAQAPMSGTLDQVFDGIAPDERRTASAALGFVQFRQATSNGAPFDQSLELLQKTIGTNDPNLNGLMEKLSPAASKGVATPATLSAQFPSVAQNIITASLQNPNASLKDRAKAGMNNIFEVRKDGALVSGNAAQGQVDAAQQALAGGNLAGAVSSLQGLSGPELSAAQPWLDQAQLTMTAQRIGDAIGSQISMMIGNGANGLQYTTVGGGLTPGAVLGGAPVMGVAAPAPAKPPAKP